MLPHRHIHVNGGSKTSQEHHRQSEATEQYSAHLDTRSYQERLDSRFFSYGPEFRREGGDYLTLKNALRQVLPQAVYRTWETSISRQQDEQLPYMGTARLANIIGVSIRKIQLDFQYLEQRRLLHRIPAMHSDGYPIHLLDYSGLYQLAHEYLVFKASPFGNIPPDPEFIRLAPPEVQAQLMSYHSYAAAMTHRKRGRKPRSTWTPEHATLKSPLGNAALALTDYYEDEVDQHPAQVSLQHEANEHQVKTAPLPVPDSHQQSHSVYMAKENLQSFLKKNLKTISPYESESYESNIVSVRDSNPHSLKNFFEEDSAHLPEQQLDQRSIIQFPSEKAPAKQTSRQALSSRLAATRQGTVQSRMQQEVQQALRQSTGQATQRWPKLHHSIESFLADISREFHDTAPASSISQARRIYFSQLHPHGISMSQFYDLLVFFKAEAQYAVIAKRNPDGQPNRMAWFFAAIRNHIQRVLTWASQSGAAIVDTMFHLVPAWERKAAAQATHQQHQLAPALPESSTPSLFDPLEKQSSACETDMPAVPLEMLVPSADLSSLRTRQTLKNLRYLINGSIFVRRDTPCRQCHSIVFTLLHGRYCCVVCQPSKDWGYSVQQRIIHIVKNLDEPPSENEVNRASSEQ